MLLKQLILQQFHIFNKHLTWYNWNSRFQYVHYGQAINLDRIHFFFHTL